MLVLVDFPGGLGGGRGVQAARGIRFGGGGEAGVAQLFGGFRLVAQAPGALGTGAAQLGALSSVVCRVRGAQVVAVGCAEFVLVGVVGHGAHRGLQVGLSGHPVGDVVAALVADVVAGDGVGVAVVLGRERPYVLCGDVVEWGGVGLPGFERGGAV